MKLLRTVPGIGDILAPLVWLEIGDVERFPRAENLASYAGLVPRIHASGGRIQHEGTCRNVNQYLKWGFVEAATCSLRIKAYGGTHVEIQEQRPQGQDFAQRDLAGVHARTRDRFHRRGQQRLSHPLGQTHPGPTRTFLQQRELRLAHLRAD